MKFEEDRIQQSCVRYTRIQYPEAILFHCNNSVYSNGPTAQRRTARLKSMGMLPGVSDLILCFKGRTVFIELKTPKGRQTEKQQEFENKAELNGFDYYLVRSFDEYKQLIDRLI